jgi:bifunctional enzyme CysN/CysC
MANPANLFRIDHRVLPDERAKRNGHPGTVLWFTGLSGSGKSTVGLELERQLFDDGWQAYLLDGDNFRHGLNADLGFSPEDRTENIRRAAHVAALLADAGVLVIAAFISPYRADREVARKAAASFHEIYFDADVNTCRQRDPKGLYAKAMAGDIPEFTGVSAPYERPLSPELVLDTTKLTVAESVAVVRQYLRRALGA